MLKNNEGTTAVLQDADFGLKTMEILYLRSTVKKINNQAIRVPHLAKPQNVVKQFSLNRKKSYYER